MPEFVHSLMYVVAPFGLLVLPVLAIVCLVMAGMRHGRLSVPLFVAGLLPPSCVIAWAVWDWWNGGGVNGDQKVLFFGSLATAIVLTMAMVATRRGWPSSRILTLVGLAIPVVAAMPVVIFMIAVILSGGME